MRCRPVHVVTVLALIGPALSSPGAQQPAPTAPTAPMPGQPVPGQPLPGPPGIQAPARDRPAGEPARGTAVVRGQVVAADTGAPLRRATVRVSETRGQASGVTQTDSEGRFEVRELPAGRYVVSAARSGYVTMQLGQRAPFRAGTPLELADGQRVERLQLALPRAGVITGRIVDELGEPMASVQVTIQRLASAGGGRRLVGVGDGGGFDRTDDLGQFRLYGLPPGDYYVSATLREMPFVPMNTLPSTGASEGFAPTYFPGTASLADARRVTVRAGQEVTNVSFALVSARTARVTGRITTSTGEPFAGGMLMVVPRSDVTVDGPVNISGVQVRADGTFQTAPLAPGAYTIVAQPRGDGRDGDSEVARVDITVDGVDVTDMMIVTGRGGVIRGRVVTDDGTPIDVPARQVRVFAQPRDPGRPMMGMRPGTVRDDWTFELSGLTEPVRLFGTAGMSGGWTLRHAWSDGVDLLDDPADIAPGRVLDNVDLVFTRKVTELTGLVTDDRGQPVTDAAVVIFPEDRARWTTGSRYLRGARPDTNGKYAVALTPRDDYRVVVVRDLEEGQATDPEFLNSALDHATRVRIAEGETQTLNLRLR